MEEMTRFIIPVNWHTDDQEIDNPENIDEPQEPPIVAQPKIEIPENLETLDAKELAKLIKEQARVNKEQALDLEKSRETARKRLHEIMEKKEKFRLIEAEKEAAKTKELVEKEEYKKLYENSVAKTELLQKDVAKTRAHLETKFETLKDELPEEYQGLIPDVDVRDKIKFIENFKKTVLANKPVEVPQEPKKVTPIGGTGTPEKQTPAPSKTNTMESAINSAASYEELERIINGLK